MTNKLKRCWAALLCLTTFSLSALSQNMITNGDFESGTTGWYNMNSNGSVASFTLATGTDAYKGTNSLKIDVTTLGTNAWDIQSLNGAWASVKGTSYTLTFWAKSAVDGQSFKMVQQVGSSYSEKTFKLTTSYTQYTWTFTAGENALEFKLQFPALGTFYIDEIAIPTPSTGTTSSSNMVANGNFEADFTNWQNLSTPTGNTFSIVTGTDAAEGNKAMKVVVAQAGTNPWDVQSIHSGWSSVKGTSYTVTFYGKAATDGAKIKILQQNTTYSSKDISLTTTYTKYSWTFSAQEDGLMVRFNFPEAGTFYLDDIFIADPNAAKPDTLDTATISLAKTYQTMVGFGGALTWYSGWIKNSNVSNQEEFYSWAFDSLGIDILRVMNNYYPDNYLTNYPANNSVSSLPSARKSDFNNAVEFSARLKKNIPDAQVLMCSWSPPAELKSNDNLREGGLKKGTNGFMYSEYGRYWADVITAYKTAGFQPDYVSIQNEPGFQNSGWETCEFRPTETTDYASYATAFDSVYSHLSTLSWKPKLLGPEVENIGTDADLGGANTFTSYASTVKGKTGLSGYAYHLYNFSGNGEAVVMSSSTANALKVIPTSYSDKPNFMTEMGSFDWFTNALMIHQTITQANASAYIHWELAWEDNNYTAIALTSAGAYTIKPMFYTLKHFAKFVDKDYVRIDVANGNSTLAISGYKHPSKNQVTLVMINRASNSVYFTVNLGKTITGSKAYQTVDGSWFKNIGSLDTKNQVKLPARSITTIVVDYTDNTPITQTINLSTGWNLISTNVRPTDSSIATLFNGLNMQTIKNMDGFWLKNQADEFNTLKKLTPGAAYLVKMIDAGDLKITGTPIAETVKTQSGISGWQLLGCPYQAATAISTDFSASNCSAIKNFDAFWIPNNANSKLLNLEPGKGYFLKK